MEWRQWWPLAAWLGLVGLAVAWFAANALAERDKALRDAETRATTFADVAVENVHRLIEGADTALIAVSIMIGPTPDWNALPRDPALWQAMHDIGASLATVPKPAAGITANRPCCHKG